MQACALRCAYREAAVTTLGGHGERAATSPRGERTILRLIEDRPVGGQPQQCRAVFDDLVRDVEEALGGCMLAEVVSFRAVGALHRESARRVSS